jgi:endonuclease G, mitochondrial
VTIVQHPDGDYKQVVLRENRILHRGDTVLHYVADTEAGASGSPVFNDIWQVVALHHWGEPHRERSVDGKLLPTDVNEGIRISAIVTELQRRATSLNSNRRQLLQAVFNAPPPEDFGSRLILIPSTGSQSIFPNSVVADRLDIVEPDAISERSVGAPASRIDAVYANRRGYNDRFLENFLIPMPQLNANQRSVAARVSSVGDISNPYELKYQHFSVVLNA